MVLGLENVLCYLFQYIWYIFWGEIIQRTVSEYCFIVILLGAENQPNSLIICSDGALIQRAIYSKPHALKILSGVQYLKLL